MIPDDLLSSFLSVCCFPSTDMMNRLLLEIEGTDFSLSVRPSLLSLTSIQVNFLLVCLLRFHVKVILTIFLSFPYQIMSDDDVEDVEDVRTQVKMKGRKFHF